MPQANFLFDLSNDKLLVDKIIKFEDIKVEADKPKNFCKPFPKN